MTAIAKKLDARLTRWAPETAKKVEQLVAEIIDLADHDVLDLVRSRKVEQEVLDIWAFSPRLFNGSRHTRSSS